MSAEIPPEPLSTLTTIGVGGMPSRLLKPATAEDLVEHMRGLWERGEEWLALGGGSNTLAADEGFEGTIVRIATTGVERLEADGRPGVVRLRAQAGENWDDLVALSVREGWSGIAALSGIPGSVGAAPVQNIGAYGQELSAVLHAIDFLDAATGLVRRLGAEDLGLGYRTSTLKRGTVGLVLAVELDLREDAGLAAPVAYDQLARALDVPLGRRVPVSDLRRAVLGLRAAKGMLLDPADPDSRSAGSFFTNPVVDENTARRLLPASAPRWPVEAEPADTVRPLGAEPPVDPALYRRGSRRVKLSAAWMIEHAGIHRGFGLPGSRAALSSKHTLALVNRGGASAAEIVQLAGFIRARVQAEFGILLQPEPVLVGLELD